MAKLCVGDADRTEIVGESANFFATRETNEVSFDLKTWYKEGDLVYYVPDGKEMVKSEIVAIYDDGRILLGTENGTYNCKLGSMIIGQHSYGENIEYDQDSFYAVRELVQFSIDLENWFSIGQRCIIKTHERMYASCEIKNVFDNGIILVEDDGEESSIDYSCIESISDFFENTSYIVAMSERKPKIVMTYVPNQKRARIRHCS